MTSPPRQHDELSLGTDRPRALWPRGWLATTVLVAAVAAAAGHQVGRRSAPDAAAPSVPPSPSATPAGTAGPPAPDVVGGQPTATAFAGPRIGAAVAGRLVVAGRDVVVRAVAPDAVPEPVTGLPTRAQVRRVLPVRGGVLLLAVDPAVSDDVAGEVFLLPDGTTAARPLGVTAVNVLPGTTDETFWVDDPDRPAARGRAAEYALSGRLVRREEYAAGWSLIRGVVGGLLMRETGSAGSSTGVTVWDSAKGETPVRLPRASVVVATTPTLLAWQSGECLVPLPDSCVVHVTELRTRTTYPVPLPEGYGLAFGSFSPGGSRLALAMFRDADLPLYADGAVVDLTSGELTRLQGAAFTPPGSSHLAWTPDGNGLVLGAAGAGTTRLAAWRDGDAGVALLDGQYADLAGLAIR
ncbi:MAG TPA: hypothetical protein VEZ46_16940 [Mycobacteriales bacterium]|nr:hypothetical protein [Mycobacteriales bacterium]